LLKFQKIGQPEQMFSGSETIVSTDRQRPQRQIHNIIRPHAYSSLLFTKNRNMCHHSMTYATME